MFSKEYPLSLRIEHVGKGEILYNHYSSLLPEVVADWLGLNSSSGTMDRAASLVAMNDAGNSFSVIADVIESDPKGLFVTPDEE